MPPLSDFLGTGRIGVLDAAASRDAVLEAAARLLADGSDEAALAIADSLRQRERLGSTAIGHGVAVPHGRSSVCDTTRAAFLRVEPAVDFCAADGQAVDLVLAMAAPEHFTQQHLQLLSEIAERFADPGFRDALRAAPDADALRAVLVDVVAAG